MKKSKKAISVLLSLLLMFNVFIPAYAQAEINDSIKSEQTQVESTDSSSSEQAESESTDSSSSEQAESENTDSSSSEPTESENTDSSSSEPTESENADSSSSEQAESENADSSSSEQAESESTDSSSSEQEETAEEFISLNVINPENDTVIAEVGEEVTLTANVNRNDVSVNYQWQKMQMPIPKKEVKTEPIYNYPEGSPTWYNFPLEDKTESQVISENPNASWMGVEMYIATVNALNEIGADSSNVSFEWKTPNLVLDGYTISAEKEEDVIKIIATKDDKQLVATLNENNKFQFGEEYLREVPTLNEWIDIPNANSESYTFTVAEQDLYSQYRLKVTITDEEYLNKCIEILQEQNVDLTEEQQSQEQNLYSIVMYVKSAETEEIADEVDSTIAPVSTGTPYLSDDGQWICGLNGNFQYITEDTYNHAYNWYKKGKITPKQFNYMWTSLLSKGFDQETTANVLDENGFPTGETRTYNGFDLTDGNKLEVNSEWYGKTVYFRPNGTNNITKIKIPAYTEIYGAGDKYSDSVSGSKYKKAITFLNPYTKDTGSMYLNFLEFTSRNGWILEMLPDGSITSNKTDNHITAYAVDVESFNSDPARYMVDAEGNFRVDSVGWGVCTYEEPDISGKAYHILKDFISNGYGFLTGHDTLYGYAGAYYDAFGVDLDKSTIDPNDGTTWYYDINSWQPGTTATDQDGNKSSTRGGHFYLNQLIGTNKGNVYSNNVAPSDAPSLILSTGGSHGKYGKDTMYGGNSLTVVQQGYSAELAKNNPRYRTPTNYPYSFNEGLVFTSSFTHSNGQASFAPIWVKYNGKNQAPVNRTDPMYWTIGEKTGTNNFYLTGCGNYLMNQIGHLPTNSASNYESILFANSVMYVSQRKQCEICAANQNGQQTSHFVRRVSSANFKEITDALKNGGNFWYPLNDCYQLTEDITLPEDWQPIKNFNGHWNSDVYSVSLNSKGTPLLANDKAQGENGWNLGTNQNKGVVNVFNKNMTRTTGVARVVGDLNDLFGTEQNYTGYTVKILGSDNPKYMSANEVYSCTVNTDSKYVMSNLPCIYDGTTREGILNARVFDKNGSEITQYGNVRVKVDKDFWNNNMTIPLYLYKTKTEPISDYVTFEGQDGFMLHGGIYSLEKVADIQWQVKRKDTWENIENVNELKGQYEIAEPIFHNNSEESFTEVSLKLTNCQLSWNNWNFRAVFKYAGQTMDTYTVSVKDKSGKLIVKPWAAKIIQAEDKDVWVGENATFTSSIEFAKGTAQGLKAEWQYKPVFGNDDEWLSVEGSDLFNTDKTATSSIESNIPVYDIIAKKHNFKNYGQYKTTTSITIKNCDLEYDGLLFRVKYYYTTEDGNEIVWYSNIANNREYRWTEDVSKYGENKIGNEVGNRMGHLSVRPADIAVVMQEARNEYGSNNYVDDLTPDVYGQKIQINTDESYSKDVAKYTAIVYYKPNTDKMSVTPHWEYSTYLDRTSKEWNDSVAKGINSNIRVNIENTPLTSNGSSLPKDHKYYNEAYADWGAIKSVMTIENATPEMYSTDTFTKYYFKCVADGKVVTQNGIFDTHGVGRNGGLVISHNILLNHMGVNTYDTENIINGQSINDMKGMAQVTKNQEYSVWSYPQLRLVDIEKINTINIKFGNNADSRDYISYPENLANKYGIKLSYGHDKSVTFVADRKNSVETWQWQYFLRNIDFIVFDPMTILAGGITGGVEIIWTADENKIPNIQDELNSRANNIIYNNQNGHFYELIETSYPISFREAESQAKEKGNQAGVSAHLANIDDYDENVFVSNILKDSNSRYGWIENEYSEDLLWANKYGGSNSYMTYWTDTWKNVDIPNLNRYDAVKIVFRPYPIYSPSTHPHAFEEYYIIADTSDRHTHQAMYDYNSYQYISRRVELYNGGVTFGPAQYGTTFYPTENDGRTFYSTKYTAIPYEVYGISKGESNGYKAMVNVLRDETVTKTRAKFSNFAPPSNPSYTWRNLPHDGDNLVYAYVIEYDEDPTMRPDAKRITETDTIGTQISLPKGQKILAKVDDAQKIYNGEELMPKIKLSVDGATGDLENLVIATFETSTITADYTTTSIDATNISGSKVINTGRYSVKLTLTDYAKSLGYSFDWRSKTQAVLSVYSRPLNLTGHQDKVYDGNSNAIITNISIAPANENSGLVKGDTVEFNTNKVIGLYVNNNDEIQKDVGKWSIRRTNKLSLSVNPHNNYKIGGEIYTGDITPRGLYVHSLYLEDKDNPRNIKSYDNTNSATIKDIIVENIIDGDDVWIDKEEYLGVYEDKNAGEILNPDGTVKEDRFIHLKENKITLTEKVNLINNEKGNYFIEKEKYSGAISRAVLDVIVKNYRYMYGNEGFGYPTYDEVYTATSHSDSWLNISGLKGNDTLQLDKSFNFNAKDKDGNTIEFTNKTFVGEYSISPEGLNEVNYPVLENYIVEIMGGRVEVYPREIVITPEEINRYIEDTDIPKAYSVFEMMNNDEKTYSVIGNDREKGYSDIYLIGNDTIENTLLIGGSSPVKNEMQSIKEYGTDEKISVFENGSNIPYSTKWYQNAPVVYADLSNDSHTYPCEWCKAYHGFEMGTGHVRISGYQLSINQNENQGNLIDVREVENVMGKKVKNYKIKFIDNLLKVHPKLRFQLEATVPLKVCMYGYAGDGEVVEPENYGITNYSKGDIKVTDITVSNDGWNIVDKKPIDLLRGEMTMRMKDTQLVVGNNKPLNPDQWIISKDTSDNKLGNTMLIPIQAYIAGGNVNERQESYIANVTFTIDEHRITNK